MNQVRFLYGTNFVFVFTQYIYEHPELDAYLPYYSIAVTTGTVVQGFTILTRLGNLRAIFNVRLQFATLLQ